MAKANENQTEATEATEATGPMVTAYDTESKVYQSVTEAIGSGARVATHEPEKVLAAMKEAHAASLPVAVAGVGVVSIGEFDTDSLGDTEPGALGFMVSTIGCRGIEGEDGKKRNGIIGVSVYPAHSVESILETAEGQEYLQRLAEKEMAHIAYRGLLLSPGESIAEMSAVAAGMPRTIAEWTQRSRTGAGGGVYVVFNANWTDFKKLLESEPATARIAKLLPNKADMLKCIRSASFAESRAPELEKAGIIVKVAESFRNMLLKAAEEANAAGKDQPFDGNPALITDWLEGRDELNLDAPVDEASLESVDFSAFGA